MKKSYVGAIFGLVFVAIAVGVIFFITSAKTQARAQTEAQLYAQLNSVVDDFHSDVKVVNTRGSLASFQSEVNKVKSKSDDAVKDLKPIANTILTTDIPHKIAFSEAAEKTQKYLESYSSWMDMAVDKGNVEKRAETMLEALKEVRMAANLQGSPDEGDTDESINKCKVLVQGYLVAKRPKPTPKPAPKDPERTNIVVIHEGSGDRYWSRPNYQAYQSSVHDQWRNYLASRKAVNSVFKGGRAVGYNWESVFDREIQNREIILSTVNNLTPLDDRSREMQQVLADVVSRSIVILKNYRYSPTYENGQAISGFSRSVNSLIDRVESYYQLPRGY